jgi:hypothetical protein
MTTSDALSASSDTPEIVKMVPRLSGRTCGHMNRASRSLSILMAISHVAALDDFRNWLIREAA